MYKEEKNNCSEKKKILMTAFKEAVQVSDWRKLGIRGVWPWVRSPSQDMEWCILTQGGYLEKGIAHDIQELYKFKIKEHRQLYERRVSCTFIFKYA